ncbi:hypothetical protein LCGC14_0567620 [marine sediment metagenome]|uniref:Uncharacterized protein n=1 Tax=marine sediment metagenome TaxID=412755 RepID=A0A0F9RQE7_9ZZZZ
MAARLGRLIANSVFATPTAAGNFATGFRRGRGDPRGRIRVAPVGQFWGVFDSLPERGISYITIRQGVAFGNRHLIRKAKRR